jgi:hypothetical protein
VHPISIFLKERHFRRFNILIFVRLVWHHFNKNFRSIFHFVNYPHKKLRFSSSFENFGVLSWTIFIIIKISQIWHFISYSSNFCGCKYFSKKLSRKIEPKAHHLQEKNIFCSFFNKSELPQLVWPPKR